RSGSYRAWRDGLHRRWRGRCCPSRTRAVASRQKSNSSPVRGAFHCRPNGERVRGALSRASHGGGSRGPRTREGVGQMKGQQMRSPRTKLIFVALAAVLAASSALAAELSPDAINSAEPSKKSLSKDKATPAGVRLQVLLDRAHFSPGEIDGKFGENARKALRAYAEAHKLESSGQLTDQVWKSLE